LLGLLFDLKIEAIYCSETSVDFHWTTRRYIPEDRTLHNHLCKNLKSNIWERKEKRERKNGSDTMFFIHAYSLDVKELLNLEVLEIASSHLYPALQSQENGDDKYVDMHLETVM
jgi:hypothetical protein